MHTWRLSTDIQRLVVPLSVHDGGSGSDQFRLSYVAVTHDPQIQVACNDKGYFQFMIPWARVDGGSAPSHFSGQRLKISPHGGHAAVMGDWEVGWQNCGMAVKAAVGSAACYQCGVDTAALSAKPSGWGGRPHHREDLLGVCVRKWEGRAESILAIWFAIRIITVNIRLQPGNHHLGHL